MPSSVVFNGRRLFRPNVYARAIDAQGSNELPATGNLAVVGPFPAFASNTPVTFLTRAEFDAVMRDTSIPMSDLADLVFSPFGAAGASIGSLTLVNDNSDTTAASYDNGSITFKSKLFGTVGNRLQVQLVSASGGRFTLAIKDGAVEQERVIVGGDIATVAKGTNAATTLTLAVDATKITLVVDATTNEYLRAEHPSLNKLLDLMALDAPGLAITKAYPDVNCADLDNFISVNLAGGSSATFKANNAAIKAFCDRSAFVSATIDSYAAPTALASFTRLTGGADGSAAADADIIAGLAAIKRMPINTVVLFHDDSDTFALLAPHFVEAEEAGWNRNAWVGMTASAISDATAVAKSLNDRNISLAAQALVINGRTRGAEYTAALLAGMQCALPPASSLTKKKPSSAITAFSSAFDVEDAAEAAIRGGVTLFTNPSGLGISVERGITTWVENDNATKSEVGANASVNESLRSLRAAIRDQIGERITAAKQADLQRICERSLLAQRLDGLINDFTALSVSIVDDVAQVSYSLQPAESLNFILITANIVR